MTRQDHANARNVKSFGKGQVSRTLFALRRKANLLLVLYLQNTSQSSPIGIWIARIQVDIPDV